MVLDVTCWIESSAPFCDTQFPLVTNLAIGRLAGHQTLQLETVLTIT